MTPGEKLPKRNHRATQRRTLGWRRSPPHCPPRPRHDEEVGVTADLALAEVADGSSGPKRPWRGRPHLHKSLGRFGPIDLARQPPRFDNSLERFGPKPFGWRLPRFDKSLGELGQKGLAQKRPRLDNSLGRFVPKNLARKSPRFDSSLGGFVLKGFARKPPRFGNSLGRFGPKGLARKQPRVGSKLERGGGEGKEWPGGHPPPSPGVRLPCGGAGVGLGGNGCPGVAGADAGVALAWLTGAGSGCAAVDAAADLRS